MEQVTTETETEKEISVQPVSEQDVHVQESKESDNGEIEEEKENIVIENEFLQGFVGEHVKMIERSMSINNSKSSMMQSMFATIEACANMFPEETLHFLKNEIPEFIGEVEKSSEKRAKFLIEVNASVKKALKANGVI